MNQSIGYLGPKGTFTHHAATTATQTYINATLIEKQSIDQLFDALNTNELTGIFVPIENSIEGPVNRVVDHLTHKTEPIIIESFHMPIHQSLMGLAPITVQDIKHIVSMPHAIAQCYQFIQTHCPKATIHHAPSTAGALPLIDALNLPSNHTGFIGYKGISNFFPVHMIQANIEDQKENRTQFCIIKHGSPQIIDDNQYHSVAFSTKKDRPGSLLKVLEIFKEQNINLNKIFSRPEQSEMGSYIFFVEFMANSSQNSKAVLNLIKKHSLFFKHLGAFRSHPIHD